MSEVVIEFSRVDKAFGDNVIYRGLDLQVHKGEVLTILGASGSGKSVMLKMMLGLIGWDAGRVTVLGDDITGKRDDQLLPTRRRIGMVFQNAALFDSLTVFENLAYPLVERGIEDGTLLAERVAKALAMIGLSGTEDMLPADLSGGMRKRVGLARAIVQSPEILLFDEPTTGLDPINVRRIDELILSLRREYGLTSIVVTHDLPSAYLLSDRVAMLANQRIVAIAPLAEFRRSQVSEVRAFLDAMQLESQHA
ncbi:MAG TPA: ATP-binding cassette domain-containing protein [Polyangiales bacterium]|nr:ATP-binding cassette domain-containing protein [Polyangiales bacterium]